MNYRLAEGETAEGTKGGWGWTGGQKSVRLSLLNDKCAGMPSHPNKHLTFVFYVVSEMITFFVSWQMLQHSLGVFLK